MDCSTPGFLVHRQVLELAQTHVHGVGDAIQPSYPLSSPSPPAFSLSQHQGLSQWISSLYQVDKVLEPQLQHQFSSVHFSHSIVSDSLQPHGMQHARPPCPSPTPRASSNICSLSWWCHSTISSSVVPFSFCLQSFPASGSFLVSQFYIRWPKYWSFSLSICPSNEYSGLISFRIDWFALLAVWGTLGK